MKEIYKFKDDLLEYLLLTPLVSVSIKPIIDKYCDKLVFDIKDEETPNKRRQLHEILIDLQQREWIILSPSIGLNFQFRNNTERGLSTFLEDTNVKAKLTTIGEIEANKIIDRILIRGVNKSVKKTNIIQWIAAIMTIIIIGCNCYIDYLNYQITKSQADHLEYISKVNSLDTLIFQKEQQQIILDLKRKNDSLVKLVRHYP